MTRAKLVIVAVLLGVCGISRNAEASLLDFIWRLSGPQLVGTGLECNVRVVEDADKKDSGVSGASVSEPQVSKPKADCTLFGIKLVRPGLPHRALAVRDQQPKGWLILEGRVYSSTSRDAEHNNTKVPVEFGDVGMVGFDPMVAFSWPGKLGSSFYSAAGFSFNHFFGDHFRDFGNWAYKLRLIAYDKKVGAWRIGAAYNLRLYNNGFVTTGPPVKLAKSTSFEKVGGILFEVRR